MPDRVLDERAIEAAAKAVAKYRGHVSGALAQVIARQAVTAYLRALPVDELLTEAYPWRTIDSGFYGADLAGTTPAEMDRRVIVMQELPTILAALGLTTTEEGRDAT